MTKRSAECTATSGAQTSPGAVQPASFGRASGPCSHLTRSVLRRVCTLAPFPLVANAHDVPSPPSMIIGSGKLLSQTGLVNPVGVGAIEVGAVGVAAPAAQPARTNPIDQTTKNQVRLTQSVRSNWTHRSAGTRTAR